MRVLLIEDDEALRAGLYEALAAEAYAVDAFERGKQGLLALDAVDYDALILDLGLTDLDGLQVLQRLRDRSHGLPVLLLTARSDWQDRVRGLDLGADDYLVKPFVLPELLARLRALCRRHAAAQHALIQVGRLTLDTSQQVAILGAEPLALTPKEWALLLDLGLSSPKIVPKRKLAQGLSQWDHDVSTNALESHISRLRCKLLGAGLQLDTVRGVGYRLVVSE